MRDSLIFVILFMVFVLYGGVFCVHAIIWYSL